MSFLLPPVEEGGQEEGGSNLHEYGSIPSLSFSPSGHTLSSFMEAATPEALYAEMWEQYQADERLPDSAVRRFSGRLKYEFAKLFLLSQPETIYRDIRTCVGHLIATTRKNDLFDVRLGGEEELRDRELILGNHQGLGGDGKAQGGVETMFVWNVVPEGTRVVLKDNLLQKRGGGIKQYVQASVLLKADPIGFHRPERGAMDKREYKEQLEAEQARVFGKVFDVIAQGHPILIYPEGTRSETGEILPFMRRFFEVALDRYILPCMLEQREPKIGFAVADTLQAVPKGLGGGETLYRRPLTIKGVRYDASELMERAGQCDWTGGSKELERLGKWFCEDTRRVMREELVKILLRKD